MCHYVNTCNSRVGWPHLLFLSERPRPAIPGLGRQPSAQIGHKAFGILSHGPERLNCDRDKDERLASFRKEYFLFFYPLLCHSRIQPAWLTELSVIRWWCLGKSCSRQSIELFSKEQELLRLRFKSSWLKPSGSKRDVTPANSALGEWCRWLRNSEHLSQKLSGCQAKIIIIIIFIKINFKYTGFRSASRARGQAGKRWRLQVVKQQKSEKDGKTRTKKKRLRDQIKSQSMGGRNRVIVTFLQ